jgi:microsomal dipeptidase-like Zn-dependent dipeptidase
MKRIIIRFGLFAFFLFWIPNQADAGFLCGDENELPCVIDAWGCHSGLKVGAIGLCTANCGGEGQVGCWSGNCDSGLAVRADLLCHQECGGSGKPEQVACFWGTCDDGYTLNPTDLTQCVQCGGKDEYACANLWSGDFSCDSPWLRPEMETVLPLAWRCKEKWNIGEPDCDCYDSDDNLLGAVTKQPIGEPLRGFADLHTHLFANLAYGGAVFWGAPYHEKGINIALAWCDYTWEFGTDSIPIPYLGYTAHSPRGSQSLNSPFIGFMEGEHDVQGAGPLSGWPKYTTRFHQQMYYRWLERAYKGGQRLMVMLAVNNELLCEGLSVAGIPIPIARRRLDFDCDDMFAVNKQIEATKALEEFIDNEHNGDGWFRIATSPAKAREIIENGKMAVVLGIEVDALFGCKPQNTSCDENHIRTKLKQYYDMGIRHIFPFHAYNNAFGGAGIYQPMMSIANNAITGQPFTLNTDKSECEDLGYNFNATSDFDNILDWFSDYVPGILDIPIYSNDDEVKFFCNADDLSDKGRFLINEMMDLGIIIDVDHMSYKTREEVLDLAEERDYPLVSSHSYFLGVTKAHGREGIGETSLTDDGQDRPGYGQVERIRDLGGMVTLYKTAAGPCSSSLDYVTPYRYILDKMSGGPYGEAYPGIAFSSDWGGSPPNVGPRGPLINNDFDEKCAWVGSSSGGVVSLSWAIPMQNPDAGNIGGEGTFEGVMILRREGSEIVNSPIDDWVYEVGDPIGDSTVVFMNTPYQGYNPGEINIESTTFVDTGLDQIKTYYYHIIPIFYTWEQNSITSIGYHEPIKRKVIISDDTPPWILAPEQTDPRIYSQRISDSFSAYDPVVSGEGIYFKTQETGQKIFDFRDVGLAHVGLLPDLMEDLDRILKEVDPSLGDRPLDPLFNSAETFIRMWEKIENNVAANLDRDNDSEDGGSGGGDCFISAVNQ